MKSPGGYEYDIDATCLHPRVEIVELETREDGLPIFRALCNDCGRTELGTLKVRYRPEPVRVHDRWLPVVAERGDWAVCARCGRVIVPGMHKPAIVVPVRIVHDERLFGEVDFCTGCGQALLGEPEQKVIPFFGFGVDRDDSGEYRGQVEREVG